MRNELPEGAVLVKEVFHTPLVGRYRGRSKPSGWLIYEKDGQRYYRFDGRKDVVDYHYDSERDMVVRVQVKGGHMVYKKLEEFPRGNLKYDTNIAIFKGLDHEPPIYRPSGWWEKMVVYFAGKTKDQVNKASQPYFDFSPNTWRR